MSSCVRILLNNMICGFERFGLGWIMRHILGCAVLFGATLSLFAEEVTRAAVTVNGWARVQVKADEWMVRGQLIQESVYRSVVEERLKAQVRCLEADLEKHSACVLEVEVEEPVLYPKLRKPAVAGLLKLHPEVRGQSAPGPIIDPVTGLPVTSLFPGQMPGLPGAVMPVGVPGIVPPQPPRENRVLWNGMVMVSIVVPAGSDQIEKIMELPGVHQFGGAVALAPRLSNQKQMEAKAQRMAFHQARRKATVLAELAGKALGEVVQVQDHLKDKGNTLPASTVPAGSVEMYSDLTVSFRLQPRPASEGNE